MSFLRSDVTTSPQLADQLRAVVCCGGEELEAMVPGDVQEGGQEDLPVPSVLLYLHLCQEGLLLPHPH